MQSSCNKRTDEYGGCIENRTKFLLEVITAVAEVYPTNRIGVRLSPNGVYGGMGSEDNDKLFPYVARELRNFNLGYLHVMDGHGFGFHGKCKSVSLFDMKSQFLGPVMGNVGFTKDTAEGAIRSGAADLIAFGRPYISNPDLVERFANNWSLNEENTYASWYHGGAEGYCNFENY